MKRSLDIEMDTSMNVCHSQGVLKVYVLNKRIFKGTLVFGIFRDDNLLPVLIFHLTFFMFASLLILIFDFNCLHTAFEIIFNL